jgi:hypothetical protein
MILGPLSEDDMLTLRTARLCEVTAISICLALMLVVVAHAGIVP